MVEQGAPPQGEQVPESLDPEPIFFKLRILLESSSAAVMFGSIIVALLSIMMSSTPAVAFLLPPTGLREALLPGRSATTSTIAQGIVVEVKVNFMIVEGVVWGLVLSGVKGR